MKKNFIKRKAKTPKSTSKPKRYENEKNEISKLIKNTSIIDSTLSQFKHINLSAKTIQGLDAQNYTQLTDIQRMAIPIILDDNDLLAAAKTGTFIVPLLEILYCNEWTSLDGLGALVISPTRELALQIFDVLRKVGKFHSFSAGLLIGGKDLTAEKQRVGKMNILVATPGRLLQHMDQTHDFNCDNLKVLVLDEADRILDCGFEKTINAIIDHLPSTSRRTLLFSATQTKSIKDLARLSLKDPKYVAVHDKEESSTPKLLKQNYLVVELFDKLEVLHTFLKTHLKSKIIVFLSSCKQVRLVYETFCKLQPGIVLMSLHGKQKQPKRLAIFEQFCRKQSACLFATDIAARGLDFPSVDWVVQIDCPEDAETYIHRVGRTARYESAGNALLMLLPSEEAEMCKEFERKKIPVLRQKVNPEKLEGKRVERSLAAFCSADPEMKYLAQKSFISYVRSIHLQKNKLVFKVDQMPLERYAESLGLPGLPKIKFVKKIIKDGDNFGEKVSSLNNVQDDEDNEEESKQQTKVDRLFNRKNQLVLTDHYSKLISNDNDDDDDDEEEDTDAQNEVQLIGGDNDNKDSEDEEDSFIKLKRKDHAINEDEFPVNNRVLNKRQLQRQKEKEIKKLGTGTKFKFDDDGNLLLSYNFESVKDYEKRLVDDDQDIDQSDNILEQAASKFTELEAQKMSEIDLEDKKREKLRLKERKREKKRKEKEMNRQDAGVETVVTLGSSNDNEDEESIDESVDGSLSENDEENSGDSDDLEIDLDEDESEVDIPTAKATGKRQFEDDLGSMKNKVPKEIKKRKIDLNALDKNSLEDLAMKFLK